MPVDDWAVKCQNIHSLVDTGVFQVGRLQKLLNRLESHLEWIVYELWRLLGHFEVEYFSLLVRLDDIVAPMEFVLDQRGTVLGPE